VSTKREDILEAAEELIAEQGFEGTSVRALAARAGVNVAMISYYFGSKDKLFEALVEYRASYLREKLQMLNKEVEDPVLRLEKVIEYYVDRIFSNHHFHRILFRELTLRQRSTLHDSIAEILMKNFDEIRKIIEAGQEKGIFRNVDTDLVIASLIGTVSQVTLNSSFTCRMIGLDPSINSVYDNVHKERLKLYLFELLKKYLMVETIPS
jgi:AcrR family transcriptional regulator